MRVVGPNFRVAGPGSQLANATGPGVLGRALPTPASHCSEHPQEGMEPRQSLGTLRVGAAGKAA